MILPYIIYSKKWGTKDDLKIGFVSLPPFPTKLSFNPQEERKSFTEKIAMLEEAVNSLCPFGDGFLWPFVKVKWPPTRESKGHFESPGILCL